MKKVVIIQGHPDSESFNQALGESYKKGALAGGAEVKEIIIRDLDFNPNLQFGYRKRTELEPDLIEAQNILKWADHWVIIHPVWWGSIPAVFKGFLDRILLPGFAFQKRKDSLWWDKLIKGKTARIISTLDQPGWYYRWIYGRPSHNALKKLTLQYIGFRKIKSTVIGPVRNSSDAFRLKWLKKVKAYGELIK